jgi:hypothetical protein
VYDLVLRKHLGPMGIVSPVTAVMAGAVPVVVGVSRGESLSALAFGGILVAGLAVVLVIRETGDKARIRASTLGLALGSGAAIGPMSQAAMGHGISRL